MKLQTTLTFSLALALLGAAGSAAAQPLAPAYATPQANYGYPTAPVAPAQTPAASPYTYGQTTYNPVAPTYPTAGYPAAPARVAQGSDTRGSGTRGSDTRAASPALSAPGALPAPTAIQPQSAPVAAPAETHGYPAADSWSGYTAPPASDCATGNCGHAPAAGYAAPSCATGDCGGIDYGTAPACDVSYYTSSAPARQWFFGLYGLLLDRDDRGKQLIAVEAATEPTGFFAPQRGVDRFLETSDADSDFRGGAEIRFGSTFGTAADPCTGSCYQPFAWEIGYWAITDDPEQSVLIDDGGINPGDLSRIYGQRNYAGLEYNRDDTGLDADYDSLNDFFDFQDPIDGTSTNTLRVLATRVRQNFEAQNLELNLWRFGAPIGAGGVGLVSGGHGGGAYGDCGCDSACGVGGCGSCAAPQRFFISGLAGIRYFRTDESLDVAVQFTDPGRAGDPTEYVGSFPVDDINIFDELQVDNELVGFQLGCSLNRLIGCKWTLFCDTNFGIYNNNASKYQRVFSGGGPIRFRDDQSSVEIRASKNDVAFLGEARCGLAYQISHRTRLTAAWRVIAASGLATAVGQGQTDFTSRALASHVDTSDSIILHGLQAGVEFKY